MGYGQEDLSKDSEAHFSISVRFFGLFFFFLDTGHLCYNETLIQVHGC